MKVRKIKVCLLANTDMSKFHCCVSLCTNDSRYNSALSTQAIDITHCLRSKLNNVLFQNMKGESVSNFQETINTNLFRGMPVAGHGKVSPDFLFLCRRKTANLIDK